MMAAAGGAGRLHILARSSRVGTIFSAMFSAVIACGAPDSVVSDDQDGIIGGDVMFTVAVDDQAFSPSLLTTQNLATVTLTLTNHGTRPHGLWFGCSAGGCFPGDAAIPPLDPGASATTIFMTPRAEVIYTLTSDAAGDAPSGQFIIQ
jgi:hypothetical protein